LVFTPKRNIYGPSVIQVCCKILLRVSCFHQEEKYIWGLRLFVFHAKSSFGLLAFTSKQAKLYVEWLCRDLTEVHLVFGTA
jgi:hypothetical protein